MLGTGLSHDGSACLLKDGRVAVAIEKERITRVKHDGGNDTLAVRYCLDAAGIELDDLALVVQNANFGDFARGNSYFQGPRLFSASGGPPVVTISHHLAHAYSAFGMCPFPEPRILVVDGCGNGLDECCDLDGTVLPAGVDPEIRHLYFEKDSYYSTRDGLPRAVFKDFSPLGLGLKGYPLLPRTTKHTIGGIYDAVAVYCLRDTSDPGKLMGLAPYGRAGAFTGEIFDLREGRLFLRYDWMAGLDRPARSAEDLKRCFQYYADIAYWLQREVERALLYLVEHRYKLEPGEDLAYAGGVALNAVANALLIRKSPFRRIFIVPAAGDNGLALGCAFYGWLAVLGKERLPSDGSTCFGRAYPRARVRSALAAARRASLQRPAEIASPLEKLLELVHACFLASRAAGWEGALRWRLAGADAFTTVVRDGQCLLLEGAPVASAFEVAGEPAALFAYLQGRLHPAQAFRAGTLSTSNADSLLTFHRCIDWASVQRRLRTDRLSLGLSSDEALACRSDPGFVETAAGLLAEGKILAWFQGGAELGPRALGRRSLLADPRRPEVRDVINRQIKRREDFRPFAPSVLLEDAGQYFDCDLPSPYMITVAPVRTEWRDTLRSVTHVDGTARLQTVTADWNPVYYRLLQAFRRRTGISVLLNTSLNRKGMPIVETPEDAINFFRETPRLDALVIDSYLAWRKNAPLLEQAAEAAPRARGAMARGSELTPPSPA